MNTSQRIWNLSPILLSVVSRNSTNILHYIKPESLLERQILQDSDWQEGAFWGEPRPGHPEGKIIYHIHEVLDNVELATNNPIVRQQLRLIAIIHDTFKHLEEQARPRTDWSKHHSIFALNFAKKYISDKAVLDVIELHDEAYYAWRAAYVGKHEKSELILHKIINRLTSKSTLQLYYLFFKCDTQTGDKFQTPITWFEEVMREKITIKEF